MRITISVLPEERDALVKLAQREHRDFRQQAAYLVRQSLEQMGLLQPMPTNPTIQTVNPSEVERSR